MDNITFYHIILALMKVSFYRTIIIGDVLTVKKQNKKAFIQNIFFIKKIIYFRTV